MTNSLTPFLDNLDNNIPTVIDFTIAGKSKESITLKTGKRKLHSQLPETEFWGYNGEYPGPTLNVKKDKPITIEWKNRLPNGGNPLTIVTGESGTQADFGTGNRTPDDATKLPNAAVVHLHGAATHPDSDGWTDNIILKNQSTFSHYENKDDATMFWYHDHVMGITRYNVYSGLAGLYIVRSKEEEDLHLPADNFELPLLIQDKNLDTDQDDNLTGKLLHKVVDDTMEFFGPINMVNGLIYPFKNVQRAVYRLRLINGSNARTYCLKLIDENNQSYTEEIMHQIGSDGGFFASPVVLQNNELILAPAERADLIIDFRSNSLKGKSLTFINIASAPYNGTSIELPTDANPYDINNLSEKVSNVLQSNLGVLRFNIDNTTNKINNYDVDNFSTNFKRITHNQSSDPKKFIILPSNHNHRYIALVEEEILTMQSDGTYKLIPMLMLRELEMIDSGTYESLKSSSVFAIKLTDQSGNISFFKSVASMFYDAINFKIRYNDWEVWKILNLTHDTHPFHVHLVQFQALNVLKFNENIDGNDIPNTNNRVGANNFDITLSVPDATNIGDQPFILKGNEMGWKDTIRINPNSMMSIAMQFKGHCGRYMYHCHLLEHEDREMMRPFVVLPDYVIDNMQMGSSTPSGHHH